MKSNQRKTEISFFVFYSSIFHCGPWRNSIHLWAKKDYKVNVFQLRDANLRRHRSVLDDEYTLHEIGIPYFIHIISRVLNRGFGLFRFVGLKRLSALGGELEYLVRSFYFVLACYWKIDKKKKHVLIGGDPQGLLAAYFASLRRKNVLVYWSLELWIEKDIKEFGRKVFKKIERWCNQRTLLTIEFGEKRCELLRKENRLGGRRMISISNSPLGKAMIKRNYYFNKKFNISLDKKIVLYAGGIGSIYGIDDLLEYVDIWPKQCVLILHSRTELNGYKKRLKDIVSKKHYEIYLSTVPVSYNELSLLYSSCDIGLQVWKPVNTNLMCPDLSSGKMFHHMKCGVPMIVRNFDGYKELVEGNGFGICVDNMRQVGEAIEEILKNENEYRKNCIAAFNHFSFEVAHKRLIENIEQSGKI